MENSQGKFNMVRIGVLQSCFQAEGIQISQSLFMLLRIFIFRFSPFETSSAFFLHFLLLSRLFVRLRKPIFI